MQTAPLWHHDAAEDFTLWMVQRGVISGENWPTYLKINNENQSRGCRHLLSLYKGLILDTVKDYAWIWWRVSADRDWIQSVVRTLMYLDEKNYSIWMVTGSPAVIMEPVRQILPIDKILGMDFEVIEKNGDMVITGNYTGIASTNQGKADKVLSFSRDRSIEFSAGNSSLDREMLEISRNVRWCIHPDDQLKKQAAERNWHVLERPGDFRDAACS